MSGAGGERFDYVTVGHVTIDVLLDAPATAPIDGEIRQPGGGAFYSALQAARLGLRTLILTRGVVGELAPLLEPYSSELAFEIIPAEHTTTLLTRRTARGRSQRVLAWAGAFEEPVAVQAGILHLAPVARETPRAWRGEPDFVGLTPQGLLRAWGARGEIALAELDRGRLPARCDAIVLSAEEHERCGGLGALLGDPIAAVTAGARSTRILPSDGAPIEVPACAATTIRDDLGAGDVFAAAFFVALSEGLPAARAAAFGNAAAAVRIGGVGADTIGDRRAIEQRLSEGAQRPRAPRDRDS